MKIMVDVSKKVSISSALLALVALVIQNTSLIILLKLTYRKDAEVYSSSSVVLVTELLKFSVCTVVATHQTKYSSVRTSVIRSDQLMLLVPSVLYVIQNNLLFLGAELLPSLVYAVCTQTKVLATALMSRLILGTRINTLSYISLLFLGLGIFLVQQTEEKSARGSQGGSGTSEFIGILSVCLASLTSATAGILLEKIYKGHMKPRQRGRDDISDAAVVGHSIWVRNMQLSFISIPFAFLGAVFQLNGKSVFQGFTKGFDKYVWGVVICQAAGGIIIAYVMKFANNILKCLAVAISICLCACYSVVEGTLALSGSLVVGIFVIVASVYCFSICQDINVSRLSLLPK